MSVPYVCLRCKQRVVPRTFYSQRSRPVDRRGFLSLNSIDRSKNDEAPFPSSDSKVKTRHKGRQNGVQDHQSRAGSLSCEPVGRANSLLEELFESTGREKPTLPVRSRYSRVINPRAVIASDRMRSLQDDMDTINNLLQRGTPTAEIFYTIPTLPALKDRMGMISKGSSAGLKPNWNDPLLELLSKVIEQRLGSHGNHLSPTPAEAIEAYISCGLMMNGWWCMVLWRLLAPVAGNLASQSKSKSKPKPKVDAQRITLLIGDVLEVWKIFAKTFGTSQGSFEGSSAQYTASPGWAGLPDVSKLASSKAPLNVKFTEYFMQYFPGKRPSEKDAQFAIAAILTSLCVHLGKKKPLLHGSVAVDAQPFLHFVDHVMSNAFWGGRNFKTTFIWSLRDNMEATESIAIGLFNDLQEMQGRDRGNPQKLTEANLPRPAAICEPEAVSMLMRGSRYWTVTNSTSITERLKMAKKSGITAVIPIWIGYQRNLDNGTEADGAIFAEFITVFFRLGYTDHALEVWTAMKKYGCKHTRRHWLALLEGCKRNRDLISFHSIWQRMKMAKVELTNEVWATYISGLLHCRDFVSALEAIQEMEQAWTEASKSPSSPPPSGKLDDTAKYEPVIHKLDQLVPSIVPINAAIFGFLCNEKLDVAENILKWAISQNIKPDTGTFNTFIRYAVRRDDNDQVSQLLRDMNDHACMPDIITFSILFDGLIRNPRNAFQTSSPDTQQKLIDRFFADMESNGLRADARAYTIILDSVLSADHKNIPAASALIARMVAQGIRPTPHIYTILITHYFSLFPPDLPAIDALWRSIQVNKIAVDHVFYDRMIEGYARIGHLDKMLSMLRLMPVVGREPGWWALTLALKTLVRAEEWELVRELVKDVQDEKGLLKLGKIRGWKGEVEFWDVVDELKGRGMDLPVSGEMELKKALGTSMLMVKDLS